MKNAEFFDEEIMKLEKWTDDMKVSVEIELKHLDIEIVTLRTHQRVPIFRIKFSII